jgi:putative hydrolase of the HAD superfamily
MERNARAGSAHGPGPVTAAQANMLSHRDPGCRRPAATVRGRTRDVLSPQPGRPLIRAVTFDVGGTLLEVWPSVGHVYAQVAARHGVEGISAGLLNRRFAAAWRASKGFSHSRAAWARLVDATFRGLTDRSPSQTFFGELYACFATPDAWRVFDDVVPALEALTARGFRLGVISNWDERLRPLLGELKLARYFEAIVISREVGVAKPSRAIFERAARALRLPPEAILHVGDDVSLDVRAARAAGLAALPLRRRAGAANAGQIKSLCELCR